jgi:hypothetical protein
MSKYKIGDIVKLRDDLEVGKKYGGAKVGGSLALAIGKKGEIKGILTGQYHIKFSSKHGGYHFVSDEMIEGLWEECKSSEQVSKSEDSSVKKYKLIDILNKIANGELKEGTKVKYKDIDLIYEDEELVDDEGFSAADFFRSKADYNEEVELIEPQEPTECEHEWEEYGMYNTKTKEDKHFRKCIKCDLEEEIEPTDNTKIEELKGNGRNGNFYTIHDWIVTIEDKLNEVIRYINK